MHDDNRYTRRQVLGGALAAGALAACTGRAAPTAKSLPTQGPFDAFEVSESDVRKVLARALQTGGDFCDLYFQRTQSNLLGLEDGAVNSASAERSLGVGVRVVRGVEVGYAYSESLDLSSMLVAAEAASAVAAGTSGGTVRAFAVGKTAHYYRARTPWPAVDTTRKAKLLMRLGRLVETQDPRIRKVSVSFRDEDNLVLVVDSAGRVVVDHQPLTVCYTSCVVEKNGRRESNWHAVGGRAGIEYYDEATLKKAAQELVRRTLVLLDAVPGPVGEMPVVLGPGSSGILLHEAIGHGMEADFARRKMTIYSDLLGQRVAPAEVTIVDDATNQGLRGSIHVDDEGAPGQRTVLVERGVLRSFLHDRISAKHYGLAPTGSGRRESFRFAPMPRMRNTYMLAGPHAPEEIIRSVKRGIYAESFTNGEVQIGPGDFTFFVKNGFLIEDGKLTRPIQDVNLIGNGPQVLRAVTMVGTDFKLDQGGWTCGKNGQRVPVGLGMPSIKIGGVTVGGRGRKTKRKRAS